MKKLYTLFFAIFTVFAYGQEPFITTWEMPEFGAKSITIPIVPAPGVNYTVDFGDGVVLTDQTGQCTHTYADLGEYTVTISGSFNRIHFGSLPNAIGDQTGQIETIKLKSIQQWGDTQWSTMEGAFENCANLEYIIATDMPDLSQVMSLKTMFRSCLTLDSFTNLNDWNVSTITNMEEMFRGTKLNEFLNNWDVSNVINMKGMFYGAGNFNRSLNNWDVSNVTDMSYMFWGAESFNQPLDNWDVSHIINMSNMFNGTAAFPDPYAFNQPLNNWDVSNVTDMSDMFYGAELFDQPLSNWDVSNVTNMSNMFYNADAFDQPLGDWDVSNVINMNGMFKSAESFNQPLDDWDVSNVTNMNGMFLSAVSFDQPLNSWDVSNVTDMERMFDKAVNFDQDLDNWDVSHVTTMENMFSKAALFNGSLNSWDVSNVTTMKYMFSEASLFNKPVNNWDVSNVTTMQNMFYKATSFNQSVDNWNISNVLVILGMFKEAENFNQDLSDWDFSSVIFGGGYLSDYDTFISNSGLDTHNYDALLLRFIQLDLDDKNLIVDNIKYCDSGVRNYLIDQLDWNFSGDSLGEECQGNTITGHILFDQNANGCETTDIPVKNFLVSINDDTFSYATSTNATGEYTSLVMDATYNTTLLNVPAYFTVAPQQQTVTFTGFGNEEEVNFCLTANQSVEDLSVTLLPISGAPRPGFASQYQLIVQNIGTQTAANATVNLSFDDAVQSFTNAVPAELNQTAGQLTFDLTNLQPFESRIIAITMQTLAPPTVNGGEVINFTAAVTPATNDFTPEDNTFVYEQTVVNSYDPNDKQVLQGDEITPEQAEGYLDYLIRFQNTGTASAITVRIEDHLPENVDWTTIRPVSASHPYQLKLKDEHTVEFIFNNINLPHAAANEPASHGFIAYKLKPVNTVAVGDIITGNAEIFFDYNLPIVTNFATTEIVEEMGIGESIADKVSVYPNPVTDMLHINASNGAGIEEVKVYNLQGRELMSFNNTADVNVEALSAGVYVLMVKTTSGISKQKLVRR